MDNTFSVSYVCPLRSFSENHSMTLARRQQIDLEATLDYHAISRCVRRGWLIGDDPVTGTNFDHRKEWVVDRARELVGIFAIRIHAYAVMSNHYHLVLHVDQEQAAQWDDQEVAARWRQLFANAPELDMDAEGPPDVALGAKVTQWRERLTDVS